MARVAIVSYDVQTIFGQAGGVGAFTTRWAQLLRQQGEDVTIVMTRVDREPMRVDPAWRARYQADGISLIELQTPPPLPTRWPEVETMRMSELAAPVLAGFDVVYVQDWGNAAFHLLRERRYSRDPGPVCVTVLHGPSEWELSTNGRYPELPKNAHLCWLERYSARHSDFVASPSRYMVSHLRQIDWQFPGEVEVLGLPMREPAGNLRPPPPRIRKIVYFGRVEERKGILEFVAALENLRDRIRDKPAVVLLGAAKNQTLLHSALRGIISAGFSVSHEGSLDSEGALEYLSTRPHETLCVIPSPSDNFPYAVIEASLIPGLNMIACRGGGVPEILHNASSQLCDPLPRYLAAKIMERLQAPLAAPDLVRYDCRAANEKWLAFHRRTLAFRETRPARPLPARKASVDVCVTYYRKAAYFSQLVDALEGQTETDFRVIAVNDGSPDDDSNRVFEEQAARTAARGWDFYRQENAFVDAARNSAARRGSGELILFVDADDVPARNSVARMRDAIAISGDDVLICASYFFGGGKPPFDPATGEVLVEADATCIPLGMDLVGGLVNPCAFGGSMFMIRRSVFEAVGGFRELRDVGHEDWEMYVRLALAGYKIDVVPDMLQFYRQVEGSLARALPPESALRRLLDAYEDTLNKAGLKGGALALAGLYRSGREAENKLRILAVKARAPQKRFAFFSHAAGSFESESSAIGRLRNFYHERVSLDTRLKLRQILRLPLAGG